MLAQNYNREDILATIKTDFITVVIQLIKNDYYGKVVKKPPKVTFSNNVF